MAEVVEEEVVLTLQQQAELAVVEQSA